MITEQSKRLPLVARVGMLFIGLLALNSCATLNLLRSDVRSMHRDAQIVGRVAGSGDGVVKVLVCRKNPDSGGISIADSASPNRLGDFVFLMPGDRPYFLAAVRDSKRGKHQELSFYGNREMEAVPVRKDSAAEPLILNFARKIGRRNATTRELQLALQNWKPATGASSGAVPIACGDPVSLDDPLFDSAAGEKGMWAPLTAARRNGLGIYFLEPYDPRKIPVIFVHGIGGTPRSWEKIVRSLDHDRYQAWVYSYPSGIPIESAAKGLAGLSDRLQRHYGFTKLNVVAHSMGGLVARRAVQILSNEERKSYVSSLTTISTPWNGVPFAAVGSVGLPVPVPCWLDLRPDSKFIRKILEDPLPVPHLLISTEKSSFRLTLPRRNDGSVSVASQLDARAVSQATTCVAVPRDHARVLEDAETMRSLASFFRTVR